MVVVILYGQLNEKGSRNLNENENKEVFISKKMKNLRQHKTWFESIKGRSVLLLQPAYNRPEGDKGC